MGWNWTWRLFQISISIWFNIICAILSALYFIYWLWRVIPAAKNHFRCKRVISRCNMWILLIVKLLSFKRYNYPFYKCRESGRQMQYAYSQPVSNKVVPFLLAFFCKILETNAMHCFSVSSVSCVTERLSGCKDTDLYWIRANYYLKKYYFIPCVISSIQAYYRSRSSCLSLLSFQITSGSSTVCNGT